MSIDAQELRDRQKDGAFLLPVYDGFGVANVPDTSLSLLDARGDRPLPAAAYRPVIEADEAPIEHVVTVVIDGFGWNRYRDLRDEFDGLAKLDERATVVPLTSTYPSETAAAMITLYTGLEPVEHGLLGWFVRLAHHDRVELSLPFTTREGQRLDEALGYDETSLFDVDTRVPFAHRLRDAGVRAAFVQPTEIANSPTSRRVSLGTDRLGYDGLDEAYDRVARRITTSTEPTFHQIYDPFLDATAHRHGTTSPAYRETLRTSLGALDGFVTGLDARQAERTAIQVLADHGHVDTAANVRLEPLVERGAIDLEAHLRTDDAGAPLYLAGSPRNLQLYVKDGHVEALRSEFEAHLAVRTFTREEYEATGLFGIRPPGAMFARRAPDLLVVHEDRGVWYDDGELDLVGMHGGLHPHEMLVPHACARAIDLA